jgi:hypothetical protein
VIISKEHERLLDSYLAARHRIKNFMALSLILQDFLGAERVPKNVMGMEHGDFAGVLQDLYVGYFVSLVDPSSAAINVPSLWKALFPDKAKRIKQWEHDSQQCLAILHKYRNFCCFHANKSVVRQITTYAEYRDAKQEITKLMQAFLGIAVEALREDYKLKGMAERIEACSEKLSQQWPAFTPEALTKYIFGRDTTFHP